jgi:hypothetical protein
MADYYDYRGPKALRFIEDRLPGCYSVVVFPRNASVDGTIKRFIKAHFLAEKLKMDILPTVIHGALR